MKNTATSCFQSTFVFLTGLLFGICVASIANSETLSVKSANPFNFVDILQNNPGASINLKVNLNFPKGDAPKNGFPAVLFVHGAGGPRPYHKTWLDLFHKLGVVTAHANHFSPRGKSSAVGGHIQLTGAAMTADAFHILNALAADKRIDAKRIAIMGASKGGGVSLYSSWSILQKKLAPARKFAAHIALYPTCVYWDKPMPTDSPVFILLGARDNWTGVKHCQASVSRFRNAGFKNIQSRVYPDAHHGFDSGLGKRAIPNAFNVVNCRFTIGPDGSDYANGKTMDTPKSKRKALAACIERGVTFGGNKNALQQAKDDVTKFIQKIF